MLNTTNVTHTYVKTIKNNTLYESEEDQKFHASISQYSIVKDNWHMLQNIPFINLPENPEFKNMIIYKRTFIIDTLVSYYFNVHMKELEDIYTNEKWDAFITHAKLLVERYPELLSVRQKLWLRMNLGVAFYKNTSPNIAIARAEWNLALKDLDSVQKEINNDLVKLIEQNLLISSKDTHDAISIF